MIFAVFDTSPLTGCINCSFFTFIVITTPLRAVMTVIQRRTHIMLGGPV